MNSLAQPISKAAARSRKDRGHRVRVWIAALFSLTLLALVGAYGMDYYTLPLDQRPYSAKHELLKPSGTIGLKLGILGTVLFCIIFLYALRKVIPWLGRMGTARHWMDFHVIAGVSAPVVIAFHASFKFQGIAGMAFWIMLAVAISGVVGRYLYAQVPRSLGSANVSMKELQEGERELTASLAEQSLFSTELLDRIFHFPTPDSVRKAGLLPAVAEMFWIDLRRPWQVAQLRRFAARARGSRIFTGFWSSEDVETERIVRLVREKASLSKRILFLEKAQKLFHLWHVIHRPFSYGFAVLAIIHIAVVMGLGFFSMGWR